MAAARARGETEHQFAGENIIIPPRLDVLSCHFAYAGGHSLDDWPAKTRHHTRKMVMIRRPAIQRSAQVVWQMWVEGEQSVEEYREVEDAIVVHFEEPPCCPASIRARPYGMDPIEYFALP